jgi:hypothetical protein
LLQNRDPAGKSFPHAPQVAPTRVPQPRQKFDSGGFSYWHRGHFKPEPPSSLAGEGWNGAPRVTALVSRGQGHCRELWRVPESPPSAVWEAWRKVRVMRRAA